MSEVYIELFLIDNFVMTFLIIYSAKLLIAVKSRKAGIVLCCVFSSIIAVFAQRYDWMLSLPVKLLMPAAMTYACYAANSFKQYLKCYLALLFSTFSFGGIVYGLALLTGGKMINGVLHAGNSVRVIILGLALCAFVPRIVKRFNISRRIEADKVPMLLKTRYGEARVEVKIDTGNLLVEPISLLPVIVGDLKALRMLFPEKWQTDWQQELVQGMRIIPYKSVGSEGFLPAIKLEASLPDGTNNEKCYLAAGELHDACALANRDWLNIS